jgi:hypothetical protein
MWTPLQIESNIAHTLEDLLQHPYSGTQEVDASRFRQHLANSWYCVSWQVPLLACVFVELRPQTSKKDLDGNY